MINDNEKYEKEIEQLRNENEMLKSLLNKNGINYVKKCSTTFDSDEFS